VLTDVNFIHNLNKHYRDNYECIFERVITNVLFYIRSVKLCLCMEHFHQACEWKKIQVYTAQWNVRIHSTIPDVVHNN
jgi:hypothetical protein